MERIKKEAKAPKLCRHYGNCYSLHSIRPLGRLLREIPACILIPLNTMHFATVLSNNRPQHRCFEVARSKPLTALELWAYYFYLALISGRKSTGIQLIFLDFLVQSRFSDYSNIFVKSKEVLPSCEGETHSVGRAVCNEAYNTIRYTVVSRLSGSPAFSKNENVRVY